MEQKICQASCHQDYGEVKALIDDFFTLYYTKRDCTRLLGLFAEQILFAGIEKGEIARSRENCRAVIGAQIEAIPGPISYQVQDYRQVRFCADVWNCLAETELSFISLQHGTIKYNICITFTVCRLEEDWKITAVHASELSSDTVGENQFLNRPEAQLHNTRRIIGQIMSQFVPGGIVSLYAEHGSPVSFVNDEFLRTLHYSGFSEFMESCGGLFENCIHPEERRYFLDMIRFVASNDSQGNCYYRVRCKDGSYVWMHDTGRRATSVDGTKLVVNVLTDITDQIESKKQLVKESEIDELTGVYNRRGAANHLWNGSFEYNQFMVFIVDIDNFKYVNDFYGHKRGDEMLQYLAGLLKDAFEEKGIICRLGGDEFIVAVLGTFKNLLIKAAMLEVISDYKKKSDQDCELAQSSLSAGGIYGAKPFTLAEAFERADANLYIQKKDGKNGLYMTCLSESGIQQN